MLKVSDNPPVVYPDVSKICDINGRWWVAHTKSRNEKAFAWNLNRWQIPYFLPLVEKISKNKNRTFKSLMPLFSGYVFFCGSDEQRYMALTTNRVANIIEVVDQPLLVQELTQIHVAMNSGVPMDTHPYIKEGQRCRVSGGPLMGCEGIIVKKLKVTKILLNVDILGQAAAVEIHPDLLEPLD